MIDSVSSYGKSITENQASIPISDPAHLRELLGVSLLIYTCSLIDMCTLYLWIIASPFYLVRPGTQLDTLLTVDINELGFESAFKTRV